MLSNKFRKEMPGDHGSVYHVEQVYQTRDQFWKYEVAEPPLKNTATPFHIFPSCLSSCKAAKRWPPIEPQLLVSIYNEFS